MCGLSGGHLGSGPGLASRYHPGDYIMTHPLITHPLRTHPLMTHPLMTHPLTHIQKYPHATSVIYPQSHSLFLPFSLSTRLNATCNHGWCTSLRPSWCISTTSKPTACPSFSGPTASARNPSPTGTSCAPH